MEREPGGLPVVTAHVQANTKVFARHGRAVAPDAPDILVAGTWDGSTILGRFVDRQQF